MITNFAELDLRPAQYSVLVLLGHTPGLKQSDVAAALGIQRANFVVLFDGLERRGLARRSCGAATTGAPTRSISPTPARKCWPAPGSWKSRLEARLDAKLGPGGREQLLELLRCLTARS